MITPYSGDADAQVNVPTALDSNTYLCWLKIYHSNEGDPKPWSIHLKGLTRPMG